MRQDFTRRFPYSNEIGYAKGAIHSRMPRGMALLGDRLMVGLQILILSIGVRVPVPQPSL